MPVLDVATGQKVVVGSPDLFGNCSRKYSVTVRRVHREKRAHLRTPRRVAQGKERAEEQGEGRGRGRERGRGGVECALEASFRARAKWPAELEGPAGGAALWARHGDGHGHPCGWLG